MRILFLNPVAIVGGAERSLLDLLASLRQADPSIEPHLTTAAAGPLTAEAERLGVRVSVLPMPGAVSRMGDSALRDRGRWRGAVSLLLGGAPAAWAGWDYVRRLRGLVASLRPDVIHSNGMKFHLLSALAVRRERTPPVVWHLRDFLGGRRLMSRLLGRVAGRVAGAVAISRAVADDARGVLSQLPIAVVHNAIDTDTFAPGPGDGAWLDQLARLPPAPDGVVRVGLVAAFARWKGQDVFLDAASRLAAESPSRPVRFYVVGGPLYQTRGSQWSLDELRSRGAGLMAAGVLGFVPFRNEPAPVYRALDVVIHASTQPEPFGRAIVEGMACGRAVVVARAGGAGELFTHDHDAIGVPPGDAGALAATVAGLVNDPARRARLGAAARAAAVERFRRERLGPQVLDAYRRFGAALPRNRPAPDVPAACPL